MYYAYTRNNLDFDGDKAFGKGRSINKKIRNTNKVVEVYDGKEINYFLKIRKSFLRILKLHKIYFLL